MVIPQTKLHEFPAVVELDLTVAEEAVVVVSIEAEVAELAEHRLHTQMVLVPKRLSKHQFLQPNRVRGMRLLQLQWLMRHHGIL